MYSRQSRTPTRIVFAGLRLEHIGDDRCVVLVALARPGGETFVGACEGEDSRAGNLECAGRAATRALQKATLQSVEIDLVAIEEVQESNSLVAVISHSDGTGDQHRNLSGACLLEDDPNRAAVKAVLRAANRLL